MKKYAIILASGRGTRFGTSKVPKQFVEVLGKTILEHSLEACDCGLFDEIIIATNDYMVEAVKGMVGRNGYSSPVKVVSGGETRTESCARCVSSIEEEEAHVVIHNAAQPLVKKETFVALLEALLVSGGSTAALPCTETILKIGADGTVEDAPERFALMNQIGPEAFLLSSLRELFRLDRMAIESTSITSSMVRNGICGITVVKGDSGNVKVTYESDLDYVEYRLKKGLTKVGLDQRDIRKLQIIKLDMPKKFAFVCERNDLSWFVDGGTLLGTVRHNAFIPWDDDIDVSMPRDDYAKLCQLPQNEFDPYFMQWRGSDWQAARGHAQLRKSDSTEILKCEMGKNWKAKFRFNQGLFLDVFPIDFVPEDWRNGLEKKLSDLKRGAWNSRHNRNVCEDFQAKFDDVVSKCRRSSLMHTMAVDFNPKRFTPSECFERFVKMRFEDIDVPVPHRYECRLEHLYGKDWRTPRKEPTFHGGTFVDLDRPYTCYLQ